MLVKVVFIKIIVTLFNSSASAATDPASLTEIC